MILMIDNYDSFTYNLVQYLGELGEELIVRRNDEITIEQIEELGPDFLMISPGPCSPDEAGISLEAIKHFAGSIPIFGVCLGHQSIAQVFGGDVVRAERLMHGKTSEVMHDGQTILKACKIRWSPPGTIHLLSKRTRCRIVLRYPLKPKKEKLWQSAIMSCLLKVFSSIRNPS